MNKLLIVVLILSIIGNVLGLYFAYHYMKFKWKIEGLQESIDDSAKIISDLTDKAEAGFSTRMLFLHHSVGKNLLQEGGLRDSLLADGIFVKGATYGDEVGQFTDVCHWSSKFTGDFDRLLSFKNHPNLYYKDGRSNDIIMFKSCFPNSFIVGEGTAPGDPAGREKTMANYRASFEELARQFAKHPDRLFIYMTFPPLTPAETNPEAAKRAREFNQWLTAEYLPQYQRTTGLNNFYIFDLFDILADRDNVLRKEYRREGEHDSHPNAAANKEIAGRFMSFFRPIWANWEGRGASPSTGAPVAAKS